MEITSDGIVIIMSCVPEPKASPFCTFCQYDKKNPFRSRNLQMNITKIKIMVGKRKQFFFLRADQLNEPEFGGILLNMDCLLN